MPDGASQNVIVITCPKCGKSYRVPASAAGKRAKCTGCGESIAVPAARPPEEPLLMEEPSPDQAQPSPADQEAWQAGASARHAAAANLAEAIKRKKAAQKRKRTVILLIAGVGLVIVLISAWFLPSGPPDKSAAGLAEPKTGVPAAAQAPETTKFIADLASMDNAVRSSAAFALGERLDQAVYSAPALKQAMEKEQNAEVRTEMEKALKRLRSK